MKEMILNLIEKKTIIEEIFAKPKNFENNELVSWHKEDNMV